MQSALQERFAKWARETQFFASADVLDVLRHRRNGAYWSSIAAELLGIPRARVRIEQVRGVRDACYRLQRQGLVREGPERLRYRAIL